VIVRETAGSGDATLLAAGVDATVSDALVVAGGDGTINEALNGLPRESLPLGVIPLGTANVLSWELGLPRRAGKLAEALLCGRTVSVRPGVANGRRFFLMAGVGIDAWAVRAVQPTLKRLFGWMAYAVAALSAARRFPFAPYRVTIDGVLHEATSVVICRASRFGGRFVLAPGARLDRPDLSVVLLRARGYFSLMRLAAGMVIGHTDWLADVSIVTGAHIRVEGSEGEPIQVDGDPAGTLPLDVTVADDAVRVIAPGLPVSAPNRPTF
jgi:diacylglycerol kinase (ATP)